MRLFASYDVHFNVSQPINARVTARRVILTFKEARTGQVHAVQLDAEPGWNRARDVEMFTDLPRGEYRFHIQARREFGSGLHDREALPVQEIPLVL